MKFSQKITPFLWFNNQAEEAAKFYCSMLRLTHKGLETFPKLNPDFAAGNFVTGWNHILNESLKSYLESISK